MKPIKLYTDLSVHLYEGESAEKRGAPTPIIFLTQWKLMGNSTVHTDEYLTQWKVEGNSVVDNNAILSCGDYSDVDGKYHVKISNGVTIYDIPLTEPLRKVNDITDTIEFVNGVATLTRNIAKALLSDVVWYRGVSESGKSRYVTSGFIDLDKPIKPSADNAIPANILCSIYDTASVNDVFLTLQTGISVEKKDGKVYLYDENYNQQGDFDAFQAHIQGVELIYEVATPTTEVIQVSPFPVSPTDTYTSANDTPYSAFEYKKNVEIWSCGEYNPTDGKYHILVQPLGGNITDIALDAPLRKVNDLADNIEFSNGTAIVTRNIASTKWNGLDIRYETLSAKQYARFYTTSLKGVLHVPNITERITSCLSPDFTQDTEPITCINAVDKCMSTFKVDNTTVYIYIRDTSTTSREQFYEKYGTHEFLYRLETPTTETITVPQIEEADSYSCVISQGAKAVEWSSFETD